MEYIYCKDSDEYEYTKSVLSRVGYKASGLLHLSEFAREDIAQRCGITLYVSDDKRAIMPRAAVGCQPDGCKPSKLMNSKAWKDINPFLATRLNTNLKTDIEPLDDTEELKADREKLRKFAKDTNGKAKITLAPMQVLKDVAEVREYGVKKYGSVDSWKEVPIEDYRDALFRHLLEYIKDPNSVDNESGIKHYKHIACNLAFICEMENMEDGTRSI
jgi:hypothetical protein